MSDSGSQEEKQEPVWLKAVKEDLLWFLNTWAVIGLALGIGRILTFLSKGGIDLGLLSGDWQKKVEERLREREKKDNQNEDI